MGNRLPSGHYQAPHTSSAPILSISRRLLSSIVLQKVYAGLRICQ